MKLNRIVEKYLNLIEYRVLAKMKQDEREVKIIDMALDKVKNQFTEEDEKQAIAYLKEQAENVNGTNKG